MKKILLVLIAVFVIAIATGCNSSKLKDTGGKPSISTITTVETTTPTPSPIPITGFNIAVGAGPIDGYYEITVTWNGIPSDWDGTNQGDTAVFIDVHDTDEVDPSYGDTWPCKKQGKEVFRVIKGQYDIQIRRLAGQEETVVSCTDWKTVTVPVPVPTPTL